MPVYIHSTHSNDDTSANNKDTETRVQAFAALPNTHHLTAGLLT